MTLILATFPGIDVLGLGFEQELDACVVRGPDPIFGSLHDVRTFHPPSGVFDGVVGGPPCQTFSRLAHLVRANGYEPRFGNLIPEFERVVFEAQPAWFVMENVSDAPLPVVDGYQVHSQLLNNRWLGEEQQRVRRISFGTRDGRKLHIELAALESAVRYTAVVSDRRETPVAIGGSGKLKDGVRYERRENFAVTARHDGRMPWQEKLQRDQNQAVTAVSSGHGTAFKADPRNAVTSSDGGGRVKQTRYSLADACRLQGLPRDFLDDAPFTAAGKLKAIANAVPLPMARAIAAAVGRAMAVTP